MLEPQLTTLIRRVTEESKLTNRAAGYLKSKLGTTYLSGRNCDSTTPKEIWAISTDTSENFAVNLKAATNGHTNNPVKPPATPSTITLVVIAFVPQ